MLNIHEHTIRFWDSKIPDLSKRNSKGKTRFFNLKQIEILSKLRDILNKNDSITLAYEILSKKNYKNSLLNFNNSENLNSDSSKLPKHIVKIKKISNYLKNLIK